MKHLAVAVLALCVTLAPPSFAEEEPAEEEDVQEGIRYTAGLKLYMNSLYGELFGAVGSTLLITPYRTQPELSFIPVLGVRYKDFLLTGSYLVPTKYDIQSGEGLPGGVERSEADINLGWYFLPTSAISIGYKRINAEPTQAPFLGQRFRTQGPSIGISLSAPLSEHLGMYSNMAYSRTDSDFVVDIGPVDYFTLETGISIGLGVRGVSAIAGYRYQKSETRRAVSGLYTDNATGAVPVNLRLANVSDGWILGIFGSF